VFLSLGVVSVPPHKDAVDHFGTQSDCRTSVKETDVMWRLGAKLVSCFQLTCGSKQAVDAFQEKLFLKTYFNFILNIDFVCVCVGADVCWGLNSEPCALPVEPRSQPPRLKKFISIFRIPVYWEEFYHFR
jgi:hypothetical protein